jgi:hypothetical protein
MAMHHYRRESARTQQLWVEMYEYEYIIEVNDMLVLQLWPRALTEGGYQLPMIAPDTDTGHPNDDIVVMVQFNVAMTIPDVLFWNQKWRQWVDQTQVRGPFSPDDLDSMHNHALGWPGIFEGLVSKQWRLSVPSVASPHNARTKPVEFGFVDI